jgi:hypothetical protein
MDHLAGLMTAAVLTGVADGGSQPPCAYEPIVVPYHRSVIGTDINNSSVACGYHFDFGYEDDRPFVWIAELGIVTLPLPPGMIAAKAYAISEEGDIVGEGLAANEGAFPVMWRDGVALVLPRPDPDYGGRAYGIADGTACGMWGYGGFYALRWDGGLVSGLTLPLGPESEAWDAAPGPLITGWMGQYWTIGGSAFLTDGVNVIDLGTIPGGISGAGDAVSSASHVAMRGRIEIDGVYRTHSSLWYQGEHTDPGTLPGCHSTRVYDVNAHGGMVALAQADVYGPGGPVLWHDGRMRRLYEMDSNPSHGVSPALAMNDYWAITGGSTSNHNFVVLMPIFGSPADATWDCDADIEDLLLLLADWGEGDSPADFDDSGSVDVADLLFLLTHWSG